MLQLLLLTILEGHKDSVNVLTLAPSEKVLVSGSDDHTVRLWDLATKRTVQCLSSNIFKEECINSMVFCPRNEHVLYVASDKTIRTFDLRKCGNAPVVQTEAVVDIYQVNEDDINQIVMHPKKSQYLASCNDTGTVQIIDTVHKRVHKTLYGKHTNICSSVQFRPNSTWDLASAGLDCHVFYWEICRGRPIGETDLSFTSLNSQGQFMNPPLVHSIAFDKTGRFLVAGVGDSSVVIIDATSKKAKHIVKGHRAAVSHVHFAGFAPDTYLLSAANDKLILVWDFDYLKSTDEQVGGVYPDTELIVEQIEHTDIPNWLETSKTFGKFIYVADTSSIITIYDF